MIEIKNLSRSFGGIKAVDDISFTVSSGYITGFLGPNGAGKTTTMRMMVGYLQPDSGSILLNQESIFEDPIRTSKSIGYLPENNPLYDDMVTIEILQYLAALRKLDKAFFTRRVDYVVDSCGLKGVLYQKVGTLSKGYRQRVGLAIAIFHDPEILILDEPTSGLDPNQILEIRNLIRKLGEQKTVLLSSHIMQEVQALCDRVIIINKGKIIVDDEIDQLDTYLKGIQLLHLELEGEDVDLTEFLEYHPELSLEHYEHENEHHKLQIKVPSDLDIKPNLSRYITERGWLITSLYMQKQSLEEIFHDLTQEDTIPGIIAAEELEEPGSESDKLESDIDPEDTKGEEG
ncbi:MAG: gliding motility-associated transport system ATP-binding protein [Candidatus Cloacimonadota bacterium]|nr:gliding motility-associated transport system ATP-binding protein [Candidatus Cloacimonadota bacterium]